MASKQTFAKVDFHLIQPTPLGGTLLLFQNYKFATASPSNKDNCLLVAHVRNYEVHGLPASSGTLCSPSF